MLDKIEGLMWLLLMLGPLMILQRSLHREIQAVLLILTRRSDITIVLFSLLFLPGVLLHEGSHFIIARLLRVRTGRFSILPQSVGNGRLQLGYVETEPVDFLRDSLIGVAPLLFGSIFVTFAGMVHLGSSTVWQSFQSGGVLAGISSLFGVHTLPDFWLWFYLALTVSSTMMPSSSDRRAWLPVLIIICVLLGAAVLAGAGPWLWTYFGPALDQGVKSLSMVIGITLVLHITLLIPMWAIHKSLARVTRLDVR